MKCLWIKARGLGQGWTRPAGRAPDQPSTRAAGPRAGSTWRNTSLCVALPKQANSHSSDASYHGEQRYSNCFAKARSRELISWYCFPLFHLGSEIRKCLLLLFWYYFWLHFRNSVCTSGTTSGCTSGYYFRLLFCVLLPVAFLSTTSGFNAGIASGCTSGYYFQSEKGKAMHFLCETSCPPRTVHSLMI